MKVDFPLGQWAGVAVCDGFVDPEICGKVDGLVTKHWGALWEAGILSEGKSMAGVDQAIKNSSDMQVSREMTGDWYDLGWFEDEIQEGFTKALNYYVNQYEGLASYPGLGRYWLSASVTKRGTGSMEHIDGGPFGATKDRFLVVILYLNDVEVGGATTFPKHHLSVEPKAGRILIFPVHWLYPHKGKFP